MCLQQSRHAFLTWESIVGNSHLKKAFALGRLSASWVVLFPVLHQLHLDLRLLLLLILGSGTCSGITVLLNYWDTKLKSKVLSKDWSFIFGNRINFSTCN